jgi:hypothetical protein
MGDPRLLFTTVPVEVVRNSNSLKNKFFDTTSSYQSWTAMNREFFQYKVMNPPFGLHFIRENIPNVDILEYPSWDTYKAALQKGYDIVGISFFTWTFPAMVRMVEMARTAGIKEVWGGNYGTMTPGADAYFDKTFSGHCEAKIYQTLTGKELKEIRHPVLTGKASLGLFKATSNIGFLYTRRGCRARCSFCPTPWFTGKGRQPPITGLDDVLDTYQKMDANPVIIYDETFLAHKKNSEMVINELAKRNLQWVCLTRADRILGRVKDLRKRGLQTAVIGVESLRDHNLSYIAKKENSALIKEVIRELTANNCYANGTYMLGFPKDTVKSMKEDIDILATWGFFLVQFTILTPFPGTPLYKELSPHIVSHDWDHYDSYHLVWDHPCLTPAEAREILYYALKKLNKPSIYLRKILPYVIKNRLSRIVPGRLLINSYSKSEY